MKMLINAVAIVAALATCTSVRAADMRSMVSEAADANGIPRNIAHAIVRVESNYNCHLTGRAGERGIMQVKPATAHSVGVTGNLFDCRTGLEAGMRYLRLAIARGGSGCAGLSLYQRGVYGRPLCTVYGQKVIRAASAFH
jgi:soluble lytic murein transglycosylase-like protein